MKTVNFKNNVVTKDFRPMANFSIRVFMMAIVISLVTVSCSKDDNGDSGDGGDNTELTATNWQKVIKDVYGFDLNVPSGWTFKQGKKESITPSYSVRFTTAAADFETEYTAFMQYVFDLTGKVTPAKGNYNDNGKLDNIPEMMGIPMPLWKFDTPKYAIQIDLADDGSTKTVQIYLVALNSLTK